MDLENHVVDTGLVEAANALTATVKPKLPALTMHNLAALAREVAMNIREVDDILPEYKLTRPQYDHLLTHPFYEKALAAATIEWNSALSTHQRLKIEAAACLENGLPALNARMVNATESLPAAVEVGKLFAKIAGIGEQDHAVGPSDKFTITINLGADTTVTRTLDVTPRADARNEPALVSEKPREENSVSPGVSENSEG